MIIKSIKRWLPINQVNMWVLSLAVAMTFSLVPDVMAKSTDFNNVPIKERQIIEINKSLKNVIEENQKLSSQNSDLLEMVRQLKEDSASTRNRYNKVKTDRDSLAKRVNKIESNNNTFTREIQRLENDVNSLQASNESFLAKNDQLALKLAKNDRWYDNSQVFQLASVADEQVKSQESKTLDLLTKIDAFAEGDERLRMDAAKAHYNMGNIYFQRGEYELAAREYYQSVTLMPDDPDSHFNLAFVSGEHLNDQKTALKHYKMYLYLSPKAKDANVVREKIVKSKLLLQNVIDSPLESQE